MTEDANTTGQIGVPDSITGLAAALSRLLDDTKHAERLQAVDRAINGLHGLVNAGLSSADTEEWIDDEILNWCFVECISNLRAAAWSIAGGCYPTSFTATHRALALGLACLEFQLMDCDDAGDDAGDDGGVHRITS